MTVDSRAGETQPDNILGKCWEGRGHPSEASAGYSKRRTLAALEASSKAFQEYRKHECSLVFELASMGNGAEDNRQACEAELTLKRAANLEAASWWVDGPPLPSIASPAADEFTFDQFPAIVADVVTPAVPKVDSGKARRFRTVLRTEAKNGPNFAGHFTFVSWGCGVACLEFAIVDAVTGEVHFPTQLHLNAYQAITDETPPLRFQLDSRLLILTGAPNDGESIGVFYYEWTGSDFKRL